MLATFELQMIYKENTEQNWRMYFDLNGCMYFFKIHYKFSKRTSNIYANAGLCKP